MRKLALLSIVLLTACAAQGGAPAQVQAAATPVAGAAPGHADAAGQNDTLARIHALVGTPACTDDSQCRTMAVGEKGCGGPEGYLAYSTVRTPEAELQALGAVYRAERRDANARSGRVSTCSFVADPGAVCRAGACILRPAQPVAR